MRHNVFLLLTMIVSGTTVWSGEAGPAAGKISTLIGEASVARKIVPGQTLPARVGLSVSEGDTVKTGKESRVELTFEGSRVIRCDEKTLLVIQLVRPAASEFHTPGGKLWLTVKRLTGSQKFSVSCPTAVAGIRGTVFSVESGPDAAAYKVYRGAIFVRPDDTSGIYHDTSLVVGTGNELTLVRDFEMYLKRQEKAFEQYRKNQQQEFEKYRREQNRGVDSLLQEQNSRIEKQMALERSMFRPFGVYHYSLRPIDTAKYSDWELWNRKLDKKLGWQD